MPIGYQTYETFFPDMSQFPSAAAVFQVSRGNVFTYSVPGRIMGVRYGQPVSGAQTSNLIYGVVEMTSIFNLVQWYAGAVKPTRRGGPTFPSWCNMYLPHPIRITVGNRYLHFLLGNFAVSIWTAAVASAPITRGHITLPQEINTNGRHNGTLGTSAYYPTLVAATPGDIYNIDTLFLPD